MKMNLALGAKIPWRVVTGKDTQWKKIMQKKYPSDNRKRCLDNLSMRRRGSLIWELCKIAAQIITQKLMWNLGNDKELKIWTDHCASVTPDVLAQAFHELRQKLEGMNINSIHDLSKWSSSERWTGWRELEVNHLNTEYLALITVFPTLVHREMKDERS